MNSLFFYTIGIAFTSGIFFRSFFDSGVSGILLTGMIGTACLIAGRVLGSKKDSVLFLVALVGIFGALGMARLEYTEKQVSPYTTLEGEKIELEARVVAEPDVRETTTHLYVTPLDTTIGKERILVTADKFLIENQEIQYGDVVDIKGTLKKPKAFATDTGREFDYAGFLRAKGVSYTVSYAEVTRVSHTETFMGKLFAGKQKFLTALEDAIPEPASGLGAGMLLGVNGALGNRLDAVFRETGIIHIVVLSGYNIMVVVAVLMYVLTFFLFPRTRMVVGACTIALFALLVGLSATVLRASIMATLLLIARGTGRTYAVLRALTLAGVGMLMVNPYLLAHDPGFQLSFLATLGIILFLPRIEERLTLIPERFGVRGLLATTFSAQIAVLPLLLYHTGTISLIGIVTNVLVLPMVPYAMLLTFFTGMAGLLSFTFGMGIGFVAYLSLSYIITIAEWCARVPFASVTVSAFPFWAMVVAYTGIALLYVWLKKRTQETGENNTEIENAYAGWVIEEDVEGEVKVGKEQPPEARSASGDSKSTFPFR